MKRLMMLAVAIAAAMMAIAETETVGDYTWTYRINGDTAEISRVSPDSGAVTIPSTLGGKPMTSIGDSAFSGCSGLTSVTIPDCVTSIGERAFMCCSGLTSVKMSNNVVNYGRECFEGCPAYAIPLFKMIFGGFSGATTIVQ